MPAYLLSDGGVAAGRELLLSTSRQERGVTYPQCHSIPLVSVNDRPPEVSGLPQASPDIAALAARAWRKPRKLLNLPIPGIDVNRASEYPKKVYHKI
jgi:hypothetical protein